MTELLKQQITKLQNQNISLQQEIEKDKQSIKSREKQLEANNYLIHLYKKELNK